jgi:hypothetical protein
VGRLLIDWLVAEMAAAGWSRLYWHTRENNYCARGLYDKYTPHSGFVRYVIPQSTCLTIGALGRNSRTMLPCSEVKLQRQLH